ncbi:DUF3108 domain-containing protein [Algimonas porphyrae]|uniref:DUF3108 domain-containing protein n=1 Tax=Algimonas porphyrae TaxID=1128113 RepID=A0ABQ5V5H0_9PROT|nr:DUF3108 domain-containing protein [Algimonas porphyrae]GLQ21920.1 hypothetical protein GCM10007854_28750 [Algimonas porphyrae]
MKQSILTATALGATLMGGLAAGHGALAQTAPATVNLIGEARHISVLNDQNLGERQWIVPAPSADANQFAFTMKGYVFGIKLLNVSYFGYEDTQDYAAYADIRTSGLGALLKKMDIWSVTRGRITGDGDLRPDFHVQQNTDKKNRRVEMVYDNDAAEVTVDIVPPLGSQGIPPATPDERFAAYDTITALLHMTRKGRQDAASLCSGRVPVFDSKQHYNLRLSPVGDARVKYLGDKQTAIHCHAYYEPISGFDPEDLPDAEEAGTPVDIYFNYYPDIDMHVPVRFAYRISSFKAIIKMTGLVMVTPDGEVITIDS